MAYRKKSFCVDRIAQLTKSDFPTRLAIVRFKTNSKSSGLRFFKTWFWNCFRYDTALPFDSIPTLPVTQGGFTPLLTSFLDCAIKKTSVFLKKGLGFGCLRFYTALPVGTTFDYRFLRLRPAAQFWLFRNDPLCDHSVSTDTVWPRTPSSQNPTYQGSATTLAFRKKSCCVDRTAQLTKSDFPTRSGHSAVSKPIPSLLDCAFLRLGFGIVSATTRPRPPCHANARHD
jgi:hypothetical protein